MAAATGRTPAVPPDDKDATAAPRPEPPERT